MSEKSTKGGGGGAGSRTAQKGTGNSDRAADRTIKQGDAGVSSTHAGRERGNIPGKPSDAAKTPGAVKGV